jgi:adenylate cyclase, class 2
MSTTEIEVKIRLEGIEKLKEAGFILNLKHDKHFEDNFLLDLTNQQLSGRLAALRVRKTDRGRGSVTLKEMPAADAPVSQFKSRIEFETSVEDPHTMLEIFERLGFHPWFRYQKYRTEYRAELPSGRSLDVMVDETPLGNFVELEGEEDAVSDALSTLGVSRSDQIVKSYLALQFERCAAEGRPLSDLIF